MIGFVGFMEFVPPDAAQISKSAVSRISKSASTKSSLLPFTEICVQPRPSVVKEFRVRYSKNDARHRLSRRQ
jgi:hypothetical protein